MNTAQYDQLLKKNEKYNHDQGAVSTKSLMGFPQYTDSMRCTMFNNMQSQRVVLRHPDKPLVYTNHEDTIGDMGSYNKRAKNDMEVVKVIRKFEDIPTDVDQPYTLIVHDLVTDVYDIVERKVVENCPEKYGFRFDNHTLDSLKEGDVIPKDELYSSPTCYDAFGNYGYGVNVPFVYQSSPTTIEDSIEITKPLSERLASTEVEVVSVNINDNNVMLNLYGDADNYRGFPNIGESIENQSLCEIRNFTRGKLPYDFKTANLRTGHDGDRTKYLSGTIADIDVFCNKCRDELPRTNYNAQILWYLDMIDRYRQHMVDEITKLIDDGCRVTDNMLAARRRCNEQLHPETYKIKDSNARVFSFIQMRFTICRDVGVTRGQKLTGRYGNKGVVSRIIEAEDAMYLKDGTRIDIVLNPLGVPNRLNTMQLFESEITYYGRKIQERLRGLKTYKEKEALLFRFIEIWNKEEADAVRADYKSYAKTTALKKYYFDLIDEYGIFINIPPAWGDDLFQKVCTCAEEFPWVEPDEVYFWDDVSNRWVVQILKQHVGLMYIMKLKQSSKKGMTARSTGSIGKKGVPEKTDNSSRYQKPYTTIPVRLGVQEHGAMLVKLSPEIIIKSTLAHRSSPQARRALAHQQYMEHGGVENFTLTRNMRNQNVDILDAYLLLLGYEQKFDEDRLDFSPEPGVKLHRYNGKQYLCETRTMQRIVARDKVDELVEDGSGPILVGNKISVDQYKDKIVQKILDDGDLLKVLSH